MNINKKHASWCNVQHSCNVYSSITLQFWQSFRPHAPQWIPAIADEYQGTMDSSSYLLNWKRDYFQVSDCKHQSTQISLQSIIWYKRMGVFAEMWGFLCHRQINYWLEWIENKGWLGEMQLSWNPCFPFVKVRTEVGSGERLNTRGIQYWPRLLSFKVVEDLVWINEMVF